MARCRTWLLRSSRDLLEGRWFPCHPTLQHAINEMNGERLREPQSRAEQRDRNLLAGMSPVEWWGFGGPP